MSIFDLFSETGFDSGQDNARIQVWSGLREVLCRAANEYINSNPHRIPSNWGIRFVWLEFITGRNPCRIMTDTFSVPSNSITVGQPAKEALERIAEEAKSYAEYACREEIKACWLAELAEWEKRAAHVREVLKGVYSQPPTVV